MNGVHPITPSKNNTKKDGDEADPDSKKSFLSEHDIHTNNSRNRKSGVYGLLQSMGNLFGSDGNKKKKKKRRLGFKRQDLPQISMEKYEKSAMHVNQATSNYFQGIREAAIRRMEDDRGFTTIVGDTKGKKIPVFLPNDPFRRVWDVLVIILVMYNAITLPLLTGFSDEINQSSAWQAFDYLIDFFFFVDILVNFRTAYEEEHQMIIIVDTQSIKKRYMKGWFLIDFLSIVPIELIVLLFAKISGSKASSDSQVKLLALLKLPRLLRLGRLLKFMEGLAYANLFKIGKLFCTFVLSSHWVACLFGFITSLQKSDNGWWAEKIKEGVVADHNALSSKYVAFFYASILLIIGENIDPRTETERGFFSVMILFGAALYATIFGNVSLLIATMNMETTTYANKVSSVNRTMRALNLPPEVQERIRMYHEYMFHRYRSADREEFVRDLSSPLRAEVLLYINVNLLKSIPLFEDSDPMFLITVCHHLLPKVFQPGDYVTRIGQPGDKLYFISVGELEVESLDSNGNLVPASKLFAGSYFGERAIVDPHYLLTYSCRAVVYSDLNVMRREDLMICLKDFPDTKKRVFQKAHQEKANRGDSMTGVVVGALRGMQMKRKSEGVRIDKGLLDRVQKQQDGSQKQEEIKATPEQMAAYKKAFAAFDRDKDSTIDTAELGVMMRSIGFFPTEEQIQDMIDEVDEDRSGKIDFDEFVKMMGNLTKQQIDEDFMEAEGGAQNSAALGDVSNLLVNISAQIEALARNQDIILRRIVRVEDEVNKLDRKGSKGVTADRPGDLPGKVSGQSLLQHEEANEIVTSAINYLY